MCLSICNYVIISVIRLSLTAITYSFGFCQLFVDWTVSAGSLATLITVVLQKEGQIIIQAYIVAIHIVDIGLCNMLKCNTVASSKGVHTKILSYNLIPFLSRPTTGFAGLQSICYRPGFEGQTYTKLLMLTFTQLLST